MDSQKIFVNCPFDNHYFSLLKPLLFTLVYMNLKPQISEITDSGQIRINKIINFIKNSKYSIHDLSRMEPLITGDLPRFNMPFECGIDFGIRYSGNNEYDDKIFLILEKEKHRYDEVISDISGNDIQAHKNDREIIIKVIRDWYKVSNPNVPRHKEIWLAFNQFEYDYEQILIHEDYDPKDIKSLTFSDIIEFMQDWISNYKKT